LREIVKLDEDQREDKIKLEKSSNDIHFIALPLPFTPPAPPPHAFLILSVLCTLSLSPRSLHVCTSPSCNPFGWSYCGEAWYVLALCVITTPTITVILTSVFVRHSFYCIVISRWSCCFSAGCCIAILDVALQHVVDYHFDCCSRKRPRLRATAAPTAPTTRRLVLVNLGSICRIGSGFRSRHRVRVGCTGARTTPTRLRSGST
jgi:hypothetical protein